MGRIPIIRLGTLLIATVQEDLRDRDALQLQQDLAGALSESGASGVILDISVVEMIDSFLGRLLHDAALTTQLLGAETVVVGMRPAVAITLVELGLPLQGVRTALTVEKGMALLGRRSRGGPEGTRHR